jgi:hypothetical protein
MPFWPHLQHQHSLITTARSLTIVIPAGETRALFLMVHGYTFHSQYFSELAQAMLPHGTRPSCNATTTSILCSPPFTPSCWPRAASLRTAPAADLDPPPPGIKSCTLDLTGHGRSGSLRDQRAFVESMQDWVDDVDLYAHYLHLTNPGTPPTTPAQPDMPWSSPC